MRKFLAVVLAVVTLGVTTTTRANAQGANNNTTIPFVVMTLFTPGTVAVFVKSDGTAGRTGNVGAEITVVNSYVAGGVVNAGPVPESGRAYGLLEKIVDLGVGNVQALELIVGPVQLAVTAHQQANPQIEYAKLVEQMAGRIGVDWLRYSTSPELSSGPAGIGRRACSPISAR